MSPHVLQQHWVREIIKIALVLIHRLLGGVFCGKRSIGPAPLATPGARMTRQETTPTRTLGG